MKRKALLKRVAASTGTAVLIATAFSLWAQRSFLLSLPVLLLAGPITDLVIHRIEARNRAFTDAKTKSISLGRAMLVLLGKMLFVACIALAFISMAPDITSYRVHFANAWLVWALVGSINAIVAESEDHAPGGFLNPK